MTDIMMMVDDKITELQPYYNRMDKTRSILTQPYVMKDFDGNDPKKVVSVTLNTAKYQANSLSNKLLKLKWQTVVSGEGLSATRIRDLERFSDDVWAQADEYQSNLTNMAGGINSFQARQVIDTGIIGQRITLYYKNGNLIVDILPVDMRWLPYERDEWACHLTTRDGDDIQTELAGLGKDYERSESFNDTGKNLLCREYWNKKVLEFYVGKKKVAEKPNKYGVVPYVISKPTSGYMWTDKDGKTYEALDALWMDIDLYEQQNLAASIAITLGKGLLFPRMIQPRKTDNLAKPPDAPPMYDETSNVDKDEIPQVYGGEKDLNNAYLKASQTIDSAVSRGGVSDMETGNSASPNTALLVTTNNSLTMEKLQPYIDAMVTLQVKSMRMILYQYGKLTKNDSKASTELGITGRKHKFSPAQVGDPSTYQIEYRAMYKSKEMDIANRAEFIALYGKLPIKTLLTDVLEAEDPDGIMRELDMQRRKEADPLLWMKEDAIKFAEEADNLTGDESILKGDDAKDLMEQYILGRRQRRLAAQQALSPLPQETQNPTPEVSKGNSQPMMGLGGGGQGRQLQQGQKPLQITGGR